MTNKGNHGRHSTAFIIDFEQVFFYMGTSRELQLYWKVHIS